MTDKQPTPEWIPVPPPNPHTANGGSGTGGALGFAAMGFGLGAVLTAIVSVTYLPLVSVVAIVLGLVAIVLAVVALVKRQRPAAAWITGLATGAVGLLAGGVVVAITAGMFVASSLGAGTSRDGATGEWNDQPQPETALVEWPANMETGGIIFGEGLLPKPSAPLEYGQAPVIPEVDRGSGTLDIRVYVDYRCPHCGVFENVNGPLLEEVASTGLATVELVPLTFLDRASEGSYYSSRAAAAVACVVDGQPESAWAAHAALLAPETQPTSGPGHTNAELIAIIDDAAGGLSGGVADCIETERFVSFTQALNDWVFMSPIPNAIDQTLRVTGTPFVLVNGEPYPGDPENADEFRAYLSEMAGY